MGIHILIMAKNSARFITRCKRLLFSTTVIFLTLSIFLQTLVCGQPLLITSRRSPKAAKSSTSLAAAMNMPAAPWADCSSQAALRREISNRWRFFAQPIPPFLPGIGIPGINRKARKAYEELYWSARSLEEIGKQLLREARKETDKNLLSSACSLLDKELRVQSLVTTTDADANNLWYGHLNDSYASIKRIRDLCINILEVTGIFVSGGIPLLVLGIMNSLFKEMTDNALFKANLSIESYSRIIIFDVVIPILLDIKVAKWGNKTFSEYVTKKITIPTLVKNPPGFVKLIKEAFRAFLGELKPALERKIIARLGSIITETQIKILTDGLDARLEQYINEQTDSRQSNFPTLMAPDVTAAVADSNVSLTLLEITPAAAATEVNTSVPTITASFGETVQAVNFQGQLFHQSGEIVPTNCGIIGDTVFCNLTSTLQPNTSYTMRLQAGSVRGVESGALNQELSWSFVTDATTLINGSSALVTNTGGIGLRLRSNPSTSAGIVTTLPEGTRLTVTGGSAQSSGYTWYPVQTPGGQTGWSATGNWLTAVDQYGFRPNGEVRVSNTSGVGLRLRVDAGEASPVITTLPEGTVVKLTGEPVFADGYSWFPVQTADGTQGYSAVARWLIPYSQSGASNLVVRTIATSTSAKLDWGQTTTFDFYVTDGNGLPVSGATVSGENGLASNIYSLSDATDSSGKTSYTVTVPSGRANGLYPVSAFASKGGFSNSLQVKRDVEVSHGCSYLVTATDSTFSPDGGVGSISIITQPGCGWSVPQYPGFVSLTSPDNGFGDGEVTFNVSPNPSAATRAGNIIVAGSTVTVNQGGGQAYAQTSVGTDPDGLSFTVDGQTYTSRQSFAWPNGSSHTVGTTTPQTIGVNQFNFTGWTDGGSQAHSVTANGSLSLTALFALPARTNVALDYSWQTRPITITHGWGATAVTPGDGFLYVLGGSINRGRFSRYDPISNVWTQLPAIPGEGTIEGGAAALGGKIYVFGNPFNSAMYVYDLAVGQWIAGTRAGPYPFVTRGISFVVAGGVLYAVGGANNNLDPVPGLKKYDPVSDTWTQMADMPTPRGFAATTLIDGRIYVAGGNASGYGSTSVNIYDPQNNTWSAGTPLPQTRILATAIAIDSRLLVIGGSNGSVETRTVLEYNPVSDVWRELSPFNQGRYGAVGAFLRGRLYVIGGVDAANPNTPIANQEEGTPSAWAPTLSLGQVFGANSGNRYGFFDLTISTPQSVYTPLTLTSSDPSRINFPFSYTLSPGQTTAQITFKTGYAGGPVTVVAELPDSLARVRAYKQITIAPGSASAEAQAATDVTSSSASLNGTVDPAGTPTNAFFEWGTDSNLSGQQTTAQVNAGDGLTPVTVTVPVGNLQAGTKYYYRMAASNGGGTTRSAILNFTTGAASSTLRLDTLSPAAGRASGDQQLKLTGSFPNLSSVLLGGLSASWSYTNGTGEITVTTPAHAVGPVTIELVPSSGSPYSKTNAFAYLPTSFTDDTLVAGVTQAKAQHVLELRQAVDSLRKVAGLPPAEWTDPVLVNFMTPVKLAHLGELRTYLEEAAVALGYARASYTDPSLAPGSVIKRVYIEELRLRVKALAGECPRCLL